MQEAPLDEETSRDPGGQEIQVPEVDIAVLGGHFDAALQAAAPGATADVPDLHGVQDFLEAKDLAEFFGQGLQSATEVAPVED